MLAPRRAARQRQSATPIATAHDRPIDILRERSCHAVHFAEKSGLIDNLVPSVEPDYTTGRPTSWEAVESRLARLAPRASYLVARADGAECEPLHGLAVEERLAIISASNLYVLAELARQIAAGVVSWGDPIVVRDALKSSYPGEIPNLPEGTLLSVLEVATMMISLSDLSATGHLIDLLGRENVEANLSAAGHGAPELNTPFLTTHELAQLRLASDAEADAYLAGDLQAKRAFLAGLAGQTPNFVDPWMLPQRHNDQIEWLASAAELCQVMLALDTRADQPGLSELRDMLAISPGLEHPPSNLDIGGVMTTPITCDDNTDCDGDEICCLTGVEASAIECMPQSQCPNGQSRILCSSPQGSLGVNCPQAPHASPTSSPASRTPGDSANSRRQGGSGATCRSHTPGALYRLDADREARSQRSSLRAAARTRPVPPAAPPTPQVPHAGQENRAYSKRRSWPTAPPWAVSSGSAPHFRDKPPSQTRKSLDLEPP